MYSEYGMQMGEPEEQLERTSANQKIALRKRLNEIRRFESINRDLLTALKRAKCQAQGVARSLREWPGGDPHRPHKEIQITDGRLLEIRDCLVSLDDAISVAQDAIAKAEEGP